MAKSNSRSASSFGSYEDVTERPKRTVTPETVTLLNAAAAGDLVTVEAIYDPAQVQQDVAGCSPLLVAAAHSQLVVCQWLLQHGATMVEGDDKKNTAILLAVLKGCQPVVEYFIEQDPSLIRQRNKYGNTSFLLACFGGHIDLAKWLLEHGAVKTETNVDEEGAMHCAARGGHLAMIKWLHGLGFDYNVVSGVSKQTPLICAALSGELEAFEFFLASGAEFNMKKDGARLILQVTKRRRTRMVQWLVEHGAPVNAVSASSGNTLLHHCAAKDDAKTAAYLVQTAGVSLKEKNKTQFTPLMEAAHAGSLEVVKLLYPISFNVKHRDKAGFSPILIAVRFDHLHIVKWLVEECGQTVLQEMDKMGNTALLRAAKMGHLSILEYIAENGGSLDEANCHGTKALAVASTPDPQLNVERKIEVVRWLIARGYDISKEALFCTLDPSTPLMIKEVLQEALHGKKHFENYVRHSSDSKSSEEKILKYLRKAANSGIADAQIQLGHHLVGEDQGEAAIEWYKHAAFQKKAIAAYRIGQLRVTGKAGATLDEIDAVYWFTRAGALNYTKGIRSSLQIAVKRNDCAMLHRILDNEQLLKHMNIRDLFEDDFASLKMLMSVENNHLRAANPLPHSLVRELVKEASEDASVAVVVGNYIAHGEFAIDRTRCLGGGAYGTVYVGLYDGIEVAVKEIDASKGDLSFVRYFRREICITNLVQHDNVLDYIGFSQLGDLFFILTQLESRSLEGYLKEETLNGRLRRHIALSIATGMHHLHAHSIAHRDLKTGNILIRDVAKNNGSLGVRVADMGVARETHEAAVAQAHKTKANGSVNYLAPEMVDAKEVCADETLLKADIYSFGYILWSLYTMKEPHEGKTELQVVREIMGLKKSKLPLEIPKQVPTVTRKLLKKCWCMDPKKRPTFQQVIIVLQRADTL